MTLTLTPALWLLMARFFRVISLAASQASRAADELFSASKYQHRARSRKCCIAMGLLIALVLLLLTSVSLRS